MLQRDPTVTTHRIRKPARRGSSIFVLVLLVVAAGAGVYWMRRGSEKSAVAALAPIPISVAVAARQDVPIYAGGLGTVQALNTVPVHSQVDGKLVQVLFTEGQHVKVGDVLAKIDPRLFQAALDQASAKKSQDEAQLVSAQKDLVRFTTLAVKSFATQQNVDQQQAKVDGYKAAIAADKAAIESAQTQLDYTTITAPIDGRVGFRQVDVGNIVHASDTTPLVVLTQTQPATVIFTLPESFLDDVREAMARGPVEVTAYDQNNVRMLGTGKILLIDAIIDQATATIHLKALFSNTDEKLWPGEFVNVRVLIDTQHNVIAIPASAVQRGPNGFYAWAITGDNKAEMRALKTGTTTNDITIVTSGVKEGDRLVTEGQYKLQPDSVVAITPSRSAAVNTGAGASADQQ
jgi:membrane fusion protein, multidrug efflux system